VLVKSILSIIILMGMTCRVNAQTEFESLRYDEDYFHLKDSVKLSGYDKVKFKPLNTSQDKYFSIGGEVRYQYFFYKNEEWGELPDDNDGYMRNRLLLHSDIQIRNRIRSFVQLQSSASYGQEVEPSPVEANELDIQQAFLDVTLIKSATNSLLLRAGRQEMKYGSSRLISVREGLNRQAFDGLNLILKTTRMRADAFYTYYVVNESGIFNDRSFYHNIKLWGVYVVHNAVPLTKNIDLYYISLEKDEATWNDVTGKEQRHSFGSRMWGSNKRFTYDMEGVVQFGKLETSSILAWTISSNVNYAVSSRQRSPIVGLKSELISGDKKSRDGKIGSFNSLFPRGAYFGYVALIGPTNLFDIHPSIEVPLSNRIAALIDYDVFWRFSLEDGIYNAASKPIYPAGNSRERLIGHQISGSLEFTPNKHLFFRWEATWFKSGLYLKSVGEGKNIFFTGITSTFKF
jgi:hypothetical protein